jgi:hypothetical protein
LFDYIFYVEQGRSSSRRHPVPPRETADTRQPNYETYTTWQHRQEHYRYLPKVTIYLHSANQWEVGERRYKKWVGRQEENKGRIFSPAHIALFLLVLGLKVAENKKKLHSDIVKIALSKFTLCSDNILFTFVEVNFIFLQLSKFCFLWCFMKINIQTCCIYTYL